MGACEVETVVSRDARASLYDTVLSPSFGPEELPPRDAFLARTAEDQLEVLVATDARDVLGCAVVALPRTGGSVALLEWLAVSPGRRGGGTGGALLAAAVDVARASGAGLLLAEVEDPRHHAASAAHGSPWRRLEFYARHDMLLLDLPYFQPPIAAGQGRVADMLLLARVLRPGAEQPAVLRPAVVDFLTSYVPRLPGADPEHDALLAAARSVTVGSLGDLLSTEAPTPADR